MIGIYKITNLINNKSYIGLSNNIERRWSEHKNVSNWEREPKKSLYLAFKKYGIDNFLFEVIEECPKNMLKEREKFYIEYFGSYKNGYNQTCGGEDYSGENHPGHKLTAEDVVNIRIRYNNLERKETVYKDYCLRIGEAGFSKIWKGETWKSILPEVYSEENKQYHKRNTGNAGSKNGRSKLNEDEVYQIRLMKKNGIKLNDVYQFYKDKITKGSFENIWTYQNWKNIIV